MPPAKPIEVLYCCSDSEKDEAMRQQLEKHLQILQRQGVITTWHKGMISPGKEWESETYKQLMTADIILPLISSDFFASNYNWDVVRKRSIQQHKAGKARVIPILLRRVDDWQAAFGNLKLKALPEGEKPITDWKPYDNAFENIAKGIRKVVEELTASPFSLKSHPHLRTGATAVSRTIAFVLTNTVSSLSQKPKSRRRKRPAGTANITPILIGILVVGTIAAIQQLSNTESISSSVPNPTIISTQNKTPVGWIWIGIVQNQSGTFYIGEPLMQISDPHLARIDSPVIPSTGQVVTVKNKVYTWIDPSRSHNSKSPKAVYQIGPEVKLVILEVKAIKESSSNSIPIKLWAKVGR